MRVVRMMRGFVIAAGPPRTPANDGFSRAPSAAPLPLRRVISLAEEFPVAAYVRPRDIWV